MDTSSLGGNYLFRGENANRNHREGVEGNLVINKKEASYRLEIRPIIHSLSAVGSEQNQSCDEEMFTKFMFTVLLKSRRQGASQVKI